LSTTEDGNAFRDSVIRLLRAAGFDATSEVAVGHKNADVLGVWLRDEIAGEQRYAFETKAYDGSLQLGPCSKFANEYGPLVQNRIVDQAWLVSRGPITPKGRQAAQSQRGLQAMTFDELQRRLMRLDRLLNDVANSYAASRLTDYYIPPETSAGTSLQTTVEAWLAEKDPPPLFVLGPYGKGKSTFAQHLAATMALRARADATQRVPILVRLGEIADEQSLEGLLGKVLASQHRVLDYHYETFRALNRNGRFLVIYDGFDEMKHGLTPDKFQHVLAELMKLDEGDSRILVLGRDTAFHDEAEFRAVIDGVVMTPAGRNIPAPGRRPYRHVEIRGFTVAEAHHYVEHYLPVRASEETEGPATNPAWVQSRIDELISGRFNQLLARPVHAQMLCEIAVHPDQLRPTMSVYELFDSFVHYLLLRELDKRGRDKDFPIDVRRSFNSSLAWWLWERGAVSTTRLRDIPQKLCDEAIGSLSHSLSRDEMRRELIQGCLIEKGAQTIYFHRSIQEFLVAEHLIETDLLQRSGRGSGWLQTVTLALTPEIVEFLVAGANINQERRDRAMGWVRGLAHARGDRVPFTGFELFVKLMRSQELVFTGLPGSPWQIWLAFFQRTGGKDFAHQGRNTFNVQADMLIQARGASRDVQAAVLYALVRTLFHPRRGRQTEIALALSAQLPLERLREAIAEAAEKKSERQIIRHDRDFLLWSVLRSWRIGRDEGGILNITVDLEGLHNDVLAVLPDGFGPDFDESLSTVTISVQSLYVALSRLRPPVGEREIDAIRPFFNDEKLRRLIAPVEIVHRQTTPVEPTTAVRAVRPTLSLSDRAV